MAELFFMFTIGDRARLPDFVGLYENQGLPVNLITLGRGTASGAILNYFGLDNSEKAMVLTVVTRDSWRNLKRELRQKLKIDVPGVGVAFIVPMASIGGGRELRFLTDGQNFERGEESVMKGTKYELLVIISNQGFNEMVMDAARTAGAHGGTVVSARGTGMKGAEKFLGISLAPEKDVTFIVTRRADKNEIMQAVMQKAGLETMAKSIIFSLPVTDTAGLRLLEDEEETPAEAVPADASDGTDTPTKE